MTGAMWGVAVNRKKTFRGQKKIKYKHCGFSLSLKKLSFSDFGPGANLHDQVWELSQNDCTPAFDETERKTLLLSNVPYANWGIKGAQQLAYKAYFTDS